MCGIFGLISSDENISINDALDAIKHRGPDDKGEYSNSSIHLGFRRLSIIDLTSKGHQPMANENSSVWIVFNGEIYNYQKIKKELIGKHKFQSETDTEVLIHGYEQWGIDGLLKRINGMFAFCIYDKNSKTIYLARDPIGKKPLYYYKNRGYLAFSSETKAFFRLKDFNFSLDNEMFKLWMGFPYLPNNNRTIMEKIYKIPPGSYAKIDFNNSLLIKKYWSITDTQEKMDFDEAKEELEALLIDAVNKRLIADVPIGILLSGGLDSSLITALASKHSKDKVRTINISFPNSGINERQYAEEVASYCKTEHISLSLNISDIYNELKNNISIYDDLSTADSGLFSTYLLSKKIRENGIKVVLVGEGADEIMGGYSWYQLSQYPFRVLPTIVKSWMYYYAIMRSLPGKKFLGYSNYLSKLLNETEGSFFKKMQAYEIQYSLPNHYCMKVDKGTMAASIEARAPYMDYKIVELMRKIKDGYMLRSNFYNPSVSNEKYILRKIAEKYLPKSIYTRKKKGGMIPLYSLLEVGLSRDKKIILENDYLNEFYGNDFLAKLIDSKPTSSIYKWQREWILWKSLLFSLWYKHFSSI